MDAALHHSHNVRTPEQIEEALVERIDKSRIDLPVLPQVAGRVMALANDPSVDAAHLSALIHQDQALAARVLRIANSPPICSDSDCLAPTCRRHAWRKSVVLNRCHGFSEEWSGQDSRL